MWWKTGSNGAYFTKQLMSEVVTARIVVRIDALPHDNVGTDRFAKWYVNHQIASYCIAAQQHQTGPAHAGGWGTGWATSRGSSSALKLSWRRQQLKQEKEAHRGETSLNVSKKT